DGIAASLPLIKSGQFRALAKLDGRHLTALPDIEPLAVAADLPQLGDISTWVGIMAPAGTPPAVVAKLQRELERVNSDTATVDRVEKSGIMAVASTAAELDAFIRSEQQRWGSVVKDSGIKVD